jgi:DNA mismatch repair protein MutL
VIRLLDALTVGQIAAGEVVERPMSVVKELVENALDAGASSVVVSIRRGGLEAIEVRDDGSGMTRSDLAMAPRRHATSKLASAAELERISTLGFRGEGLASIAAVAHVRITSRAAGSEIGYAIEAAAEEISDPEPAASPPGTRVDVRDLFANVPVRREFLRSPSAEFARISTFLATLALGYPQVRFALSHDGRDVWTFPAARTLDERLAHVFGYGARSDLLPLREGPEVSGYISRPGRDRPDRRMQFLFVNGRLLRSSLLAGVWSAGYAGFTMSGRQPYGVLFLQLAPDRVDPNVHPTKSDVRLRDPSSVSDTVRRAITATLRQHSGLDSMRVLSAAPPAAPADSPLVLPFQKGGGTPAATRPEFEPEVPELRVLAQLDHTFILATDGEALILIDQHAAHERIAYEAILRRSASGGPGEPLLVPYAVEVDGARWERFETAREALSLAGFDVEPFGERTYRVLSTPAGYGARSLDVAGFLEDLADEIPGLDARERLWASLACHSVVRAGEPLEHAEMSALIARLQTCENPMNCPHGRPTMVRIEAGAIARMFKR